MSPDNIDSLIVSVVSWLEEHSEKHPDFDNDAIYEEFSQLFYTELEPLCTRDRNYN
jgi:hypothetical protein